MEEKFCVREEIDRYTARITRSVRSRRRRKEVRKEYAEHIEDRMTELMLGGMTEAEAFTFAREELGDETKIGELLRVVHNKDRLPTLIRVPLYAIAVLAVLSSYFWIDNRTFRTWYVFLGEIALIVGAVLGVYWMRRFFYGIKVRMQAYRKLRTHAKANGFTLTKNGSICKSLFFKTAVPELTLDTGKVRYIINLWATVRKKKTLRLLDNGLYSYEDNIGFSLVITYPGPGAGMNLWAFIPQNMDHVPIMFTNLERSLPKGMHLMPRIDWESYERADRENVRILMLSPIPMSVAVVENGRERPSGGGEKFCGMHIWSASSFLSYLEGIRLKGRA